MGNSNNSKEIWRISKNRIINHKYKAITITNNKIVNMKICNKINQTINNNNNMSRKIKGIKIIIKMISIVIKIMIKGHKLNSNRNRKNRRRKNIIRKRISKRIISHNSIRNKHNNNSLIYPIIIHILHNLTTKRNPKNNNPYNLLRRKVKWIMTIRNNHNH